MTGLPFGPDAESVTALREPDDGVALLDTGDRRRGAERAIGGTERLPVRAWLEERGRSRPPSAAVTGPVDVTDATARADQTVHLGRGEVAR